MLSELHIENFAIIEDVRLKFGVGFVVITGETGSGKSILINALDLLLGGKSSRRVVRSGRDEAIVEGTFYPVPSVVDNPSFEKLCLREGEPFVVKRRISSAGRTKNTVNGKSVFISILEELGNAMVDIHGQHQHQDLLRTETHLEYLDTFGNLEPYVEEVSALYEEYRNIKTSILRLEKLEKERHENRELWEFQSREIMELELKPDEDIKLQKNIKILKNAALLKESMQQVINLVSMDNDSITSKSRTLLQVLERVQSINPDIAGLRMRFDSLCIELDDIAMELENFGDGTVENPERLDSMSARLFKIENLKRKYGGSLEGVLARCETLLKNIEDLEDYTSRKEGLGHKLGELRDGLVKKCGELTDRRKKAAECLEEKTMSELTMVGMKHSRLELEFEPLTGEGFNAKGGEKCVFWFSGNLGISLEPLQNVASGGELSRIMLCIKSVCLADTPVSGAKKTLVFDEIDTGIGGKTASVVGKKLQELSQKHQLICITHLPQIAAYGDSHLRVEKVVYNNKTALKVKTISSNERAEELGRMLGGEASENFHTL